MYESAAIDGAGKLKRFLYITLPNIKEPMAVAVILNVISIFNNFNAIWLLTKGGPLDSTEIMYTYAYRQAQSITILLCSSDIGGHFHCHCDSYRNLCKDDCIRP